MLSLFSTQSGCARPEYPGIYARVSDVIPWIEDHLKSCGGDDEDETTTLEIKPRCSSSPCGPKGEPTDSIILAGGWIGGGSTNTTEVLLTSSQCQLPDLPVKTYGNSLALTSDKDQV